MMTSGSAVQTVQPVRGRAAVSSPQGRFEQLRRQPIDDGWEQLPDLPGNGCAAGESGDASVSTLFKVQTARTAISQNNSPDIFFNQSINPYRGCEHGCIYCYARPGHAFEGLSPGLDFETRIFVRTNLPALLSAELDHRNYRCDPITIGPFTDCYQPAERRFHLTRQIIDILVSRRHPFSVITKNSLIERDIDLLSRAARHNLVACYVSVTSLDARLARLWEPRASAPHRRLQTIGKLSGAGIPVGVMTAPLVPFLNDVDLEKIIAGAAAAGASSAHYTVLRLPNEVRPVFQDWLRTHFPDRFDRVMGRIRDLRGGRDNDPRFHSRMRGQGPWADLMANRFRVAARRHHLKTQRPDLDCSQFVGSQRDIGYGKKAPRIDGGPQKGQGSLFDC